MTHSMMAASAQQHKAKVMLVEDSAVVRGMVRNWLSKMPGIELTDSAGNGQAAIDMLSRIKPDIIILDIEMPVMDGLTALPQILRIVPNAKVIIASTLSRRNAEVTLKAMALGASDYIAKPSFAREGNEARQHFQEELERKVLGFAQPGVGRGVVSPASPVAAANPSGPGFALRQASPIAPRILAIGSSTGGPAALNDVIGKVGMALNKVPVVVTQHMPPTFTAILGEKLASAGRLAGGEARHGEPVVAGRVYVAPGGKHMRLKQQGTGVVIDVFDGPPINHCKPAVDPMFESVAAIYGRAALGVVLTGMGADGAQGALKIADAGGTVLAQDEKSSVVWGMPGATAHMGAAAAVLPLDQIGERIARMILRGGGL